MQTKREQIETLIKAHGEVFQDAFLFTNPSDEDIKRAEQELDKSSFYLVEVVEQCKIRVR